MTFLVERIAELRRHLDHLRAIRQQVTGPDVLAREMSVHNDVLFSLLMVAQLVVDVAGELSARDGRRFEDYTEAVRNLRGTEGLTDETIRALERLPGFRNVVIHEYVALDLERVVAAVNDLDPIDRFVAVVARRELDLG